MDKRLIAVMIVLFLVGCSGMTGHATDEDVIRIGVSLPGTGFFSTMGEYITHGLDLAMERNEMEGGPEVELFTYDDQCRAVPGNKIASRLHEIDRVDYVIGPFCARVISPTMKYYEDNRIIRMITGLGVDSYNEDGDYKYILLGDVEHLMVPLAEWAYDNGHRKIAVLHLDDDYGQENANYFASGFEDAGGEILTIESFNFQKELDYRAQLIKIQAQEPDAIFFAALSGQLINGMKQMRELGLDVPVFSLRNTEDTEVLKEGGDLLEGIIFPSITTPPTTEEGEWYASRYIEEHGAPHEVVSANTYDSFMILLDAIVDCDKETECVKEKIESIEDYEGVSGKFYIDDRNVAIRDLVIKTIKDGDFVTLS